MRVSVYAAAVCQFVFRGNRRGTAPRDKVGFDLRAFRVTAYRARPPVSAQAWLLSAHNFARSWYSDGAVTLRPRLEPISAARSGSECRAHCVAPVTAHAPQRLPFLFVAEHRLDIVRVLAICRSSLFNDGGLALRQRF